MSHNFHQEKPLVLRLGNLERQLALLKGFIHKLFGPNFDEYCQSCCQVLTITGDDENEYCDKGGVTAIVPQDDTNSPFVDDEEEEDEGPQVDPFSTNEEEVGANCANIDVNVPQVLTNPFAIEVIEGENQLHHVANGTINQEDGQQNNQNLFFDEGVDQNQFVGFFEQEDTVPFESDSVEQKYKIRVPEDFGREEGWTPENNGAPSTSTFNGEDEKLTNKKRRLTTAEEELVKEPRPIKLEQKKNEKSEDSEDSDYKDDGLSSSSSSGDDVDWKPNKSAVCSTEGKKKRRYNKTPMSIQHMPNNLAGKILKLKSAHGHPPIPRRRHTMTATPIILNKPLNPTLPGLIDVNLANPKPTMGVGGLLNPAPVIQKIHQLPLLINGIYYRLVSMSLDRNKENIVSIKGKCGLCLGEEVIIMGVGKSPQNFRAHLKVKHSEEYNYYMKNKQPIDQATLTLRSAIVKHRGLGMNLIAIEMNKLLKQLTAVGAPAPIIRHRGPGRPSNASKKKTFLNLNVF